jgi:apolipoprotein N-acyltransferase
MFQGGVGALLGLVALALLNASLSTVVKLALSGALGAFAFEPMPLWWSVALVGVGVTLGLMGALWSVGRYTRV